ncbi:MAG: hypothetical protein C0501_02400 [Isosphaera sp.]|nr:hypothetical protein [Isosphaera sp.]
MRPWTILIAVAILGTGCTHTALERRTVKQASTLTDLQYKQVLDNMAMFAGNPEAMPWHVKVKGGLIQIADQGNAALGAEFPIPVVGEAVTKLFPSAGAQRGIVGQWDVDPATDPDELEMLQLAYKKAVNPADGEVRNEILKKICELGARFDVLPQENTIKDIVTDEKAQATLKSLINGLKLQAGDNLDRVKALQISIDALEKGGVKKDDVATVAAYKKERDDLLTKAGFQESQIDELGKFLLAGKEDGSDLKERLNTARTNAGIQLPSSNLVQQKPPSLRRGEDRSNRGPQDESDTMLRLLTAIHNACAPGYLPRTDLKWETERNAALIDQAEDKIRKLEALLKEPIFQTPWLNCGQKKDIPKCACYVGHSRDCFGDRYVWVTPDGLKALREFTLVVLTLAPIEKQDVVSGRGAAFSPTLR